MSAPTALITGGNAGIGKAVALALAQQNFRVVIAARRPERGEAAVAAVRRESGSAAVAWLALDLADLASVRRCASIFRERYARLDVLVNNAGTIRSRRAISADGYEVTFQVNHLRHFLLTSLLLDRLQASAPARIINVGSQTYGRAREGLNFDDLQLEWGYSALRAYAASKLANIYFTRELARRLGEGEVTVYAVHPGTVRTELGGDGELTGLEGVGWWVLKRFLMSPRKGAAPIVLLATAADISAPSGAYFNRMKREHLSGAAADGEAARRLWEISERLVAPAT